MTSRLPPRPQRHCARSAENSRFFCLLAGIIGTGMLAVPVLAGSAAYAVGETLHWPSSLGLKLGKAKYFYAIIAIATLVGVLLVFSPIDPVKALLWSAMIDGVISVPSMLAMMRISTRQDIMGGFVIGARLKWLGWLATGVMAVTVLAFGLTSLAGYLKPD